MKKAAVSKSRSKIRPARGKRESRLIAFLVQRRNAAVFIVVSVVVLVEILENLFLIQFGAQVHLVVTTILYIIFIPAGTWLLLSLLKRTENEREEATKANILNTAFSQQLGDSPTWEDLLQKVVEHAHFIAPRAQVTLFVFNPTSLRLEPCAACSREGNFTLNPKKSLNPDTLPVGSLPQLLMQNGSSQPSVPLAKAKITQKLPPHRFDLPINRNDQALGVLKLEYPLSTEPDPTEIRKLSNSAPLIALALEAALLQNLALEQAAASEADRQQIAQNLHDTLAQNISYLRLKLDQLTGENAIREIGGVLQELEHMRMTADEAYQQVRNTLDELNPIPGEDVIASISAQAQVISQRAGFHLRVNQSGTPYTLPPAHRQQILYIAREALHNVEKHASARQVDLHFLWLKGDFIFKITDDGIGFNPLGVPNDGHYGLWIMQQRAQEMGGTLKITPAECELEQPDPDQAIASSLGLSSGTEVTLWVPRPISSSPSVESPASIQKSET